MTPFFFLYCSCYLDEVEKQDWRLETRDAVEKNSAPLIKIIFSVPLLFLSISFQTIQSPFPFLFSLFHWDLVFVKYFFLFPVSAQLSPSVFLSAISFLFFIHVYWPSFLYFDLPFPHHSLCSFKYIKIRFSLLVWSLLTFRSNFHHSSPSPFLFPYSSFILFCPVSSHYLLHHRFFFIVVLCSVLLSYPLSSSLYPSRLLSLLHFFFHSFIPLYSSQHQLIFPFLPLFPSLRLSCFSSPVVLAFYCSPLFTSTQPCILLFSLCPTSSHLLYVHLLSLSPFVSPPLLSLHTFTFSMSYSNVPSFLPLGSHVLLSCLLSPSANHPCHFLPSPLFVPLLFPFHVPRFCHSISPIFHPSLFPGPERE